MSRKNMPLILMLVAGAVTCVITFIQNYSITSKLISLLIVLVIFYALGSGLKWTLDYFDSQNEKKKQEEEEVVEEKAEDAEGEKEEQKETKE